MSTFDKLSSRNHSAGEFDIKRAEQARFYVSKLTDDELNDLFSLGHERRNLTAALGCTPASVFNLAAEEDRVRCLSRPAEAADLLALEAR